MKDTDKVTLTLGQIKQLIKEANEAPKAEITFSAATVSFDEVAQKLEEVAGSYQQKGVSSVGDALSKAAQEIKRAISLLSSN